ncbi:MAG: AsmA family protein [Methylovulum sp.]|nr:AsmA family protein [Methylovulum sp.]
MMNKQQHKKIALAVATGLIAALGVALVMLLHFDWNRAKPWLNVRASEMLGRPFSIMGDLSLTWEKQADSPTGQDADWADMMPWPHLVAQDVHIGNPSDLAVLRPTEMASVKQFAFSLNPFALLKKRLTVPVLHFESPVVNLLRDADGKNNWSFKADDKPSPWQLEVQQIIFTKASVHLGDAIKHADVTADINTINMDQGYGVAWQLHGKVNGETVTGMGKAGAMLALQHQTSPYPIMANLHMGQTVIAIAGTLTKPTDLVALDLRLKISGVSMGRLYALSGIVLPETPPFVTEGHLYGTLSAQGNRWLYEKFSGKVGSSDISGSLAYQSKQPRALLSGTVVSKLLHFSDLAPLIGADSNAEKVMRGAPADQPTDKVLPVEPFKTERWTSIDADIQYRAEKIIREKELPINQLTTNLHLQDGVLSLLPLNFNLAGGSLSSAITLDSGGKTGKSAIRATMKMTARHLKLKQLFPTLQPLQASAGEINGDTALSAIGNSVASLLGASNGEIKFLINQGTISGLLLEEMGLNIGSVILTKLVGDKQVKLNCMAADFGVTQGLMQSRTVIMDTDDAIINVSGRINLASEQLDLTINTNSKGLRVLSLRTPLSVLGSFKQPDVSVDKGILAMKAGGAIALAVLAPVALAPVAAMLPLINAGPGENSDCAKLLADARVKPVVPALGKTLRKKVPPKTRPK